MQNYMIGDLIRKKREELKISQGDLCNGICSVAYLSRIENNEKKSDLHILLAFLGRLQFQPRNLEHYLDCNEFDMISLKYKIQQELSCNNIEKANEYLDEFSKIQMLNQNLSKQFVLKTKAQLLIKTNSGSNNEIAKLLNESVLCTVNNYKRRIKERKILSQEELEGIFLLIKYTDDEDRIDILRDMMDYCFYYEEICSKYLPVYFDVREFYTEILYEKELYDECYTMCEDTLQKLQNISSLLCRADFYYLKAKCADIKGIDSTDDYFTAYYLYETFDKQKADKLKKILEERFRWPYTM